MVHEEKESEEENVIMTTDNPKQQKLTPWEKYNTMSMVDGYILKAEQSELFSSGIFSINSDFDAVKKQDVEIADDQPRRFEKFRKSKDEELNMARGHD